MAIKKRIIDGFSLDNILQIILIEKKSQTLMITNDIENGILDIDNGELIHAETNNNTGDSAAIEIINWENIQIELLPLRNSTKSIKNSLINLLLKASKIKDEQKVQLEKNKGYLLNSAIDKAEKLQFKEAHSDIVNFLKNNQTSTIGWIWYARIQGNVDRIEKALERAMHIDPKNPSVQEEKHQFTTVQPTFSDKIVKKCFFCWAPLNKEVTTCNFCHSHLTISTETLTRSGKADTVYLEKARERYLRILNKYPRNLVSLYCLGLIDMNILNFQDALSYLDKAAKLAPHKIFFTHQLKLLLDHLARQSIEEQNENAENQSYIDNSGLTSKQKMILVVEDSSTTRKVISITLSRQGYRVVEAADGLEALSKISEDRPDLIMLDVILPKMDGYKILSIIKKNRDFREIPVIMLTSKDGFINKMKGKMAGSSAYLTKPFDPDKMLTEIQKFI